VPPARPACSQRGGWGAPCCAHQSGAGCASREASRRRAERCQQAG